MGGLASVLQNFAVKELWIGRDEDTPEFRNLLAEARQRGVQIIHKVEGDGLAWGDVRGRVFWPPAEDPARNASNDDSLVMRIENGADSFLLTGDIEAPEEAQILSEGVSLTSDFLKVPHHGSKTSSTDAFLAAVQPHIAAVSVGANNAYGHPSPGVVQHYATDGIDLLRTDRDGAITVSSDGHKLAVGTFLPSSAAPLSRKSRNSSIAKAPPPIHSQAHSGDPEEHSDKRAIFAIALVLRPGE